MQDIFLKDCLSMEYLELLRWEKKDHETRTLMKQDSFWKSRLQGDFGISPEDLNRINPKNLRQEYHRLFYWKLADDETYFTVGKLGLSLIPDDADFMSESKNSFDYSLGSSFGGHKDLSSLHSEYITKSLQFHTALHDGNKELLCVLLQVFSLKKAPRDNIYFRFGICYHTKEIIDHTLRFGLETPETIFKASRERSNEIRNHLLDYFLQHYGADLSNQDVLDQSSYLEDKIQRIHSERKAPMYELNHATLEHLNFEEKKVLVKHLIGNRETVIQKSEDRSKILSQFLKDREDCYLRIREEISRRPLYDKEVSSLIKEYL